MSSIRDSSIIPFSHFDAFYLAFYHRGRYVMLASLPRGYPLHSNFGCPSIPPNMHLLSIHCHLLSLCIESSQFIHVHHQQFISFVLSSTQYIFHVHILFLLSSSCLDFYLPFIVLEHSYLISRLLTLTSTLIFLPCLLYLGVPPYPYPKDHATPPTSCRGFPSLTPWPSHVPIIDQRYRPTAWRSSWRAYRDGIVWIWGLEVSAFTTLMTLHLPSHSRTIHFTFTTFALAFQRITISSCITTHYYPHSRHPVFIGHFLRIWEV